MCCHWFFVTRYASHWFFAAFVSALTGFFQHDALTGFLRPLRVLSLVFATSTLTGFFETCTCALAGLYEVDILTGVLPCLPVLSLVFCKVVGIFLTVFFFNKASSLVFWCLVSLVSSTRHPHWSFAALTCAVTGFPHHDALTGLLQGGICTGFSPRLPVLSLVFCSIHLCPDWFLDSCTCATTSFLQWISLPGFLYNQFPIAMYEYQALLSPSVKSRIPALSCKQMWYSSS